MSHPRQGEKLQQEWCSTKWHWPVIINIWATYMSFLNLNSSGQNGAGDFLFTIPQQLGGIPHNRPVVKGRDDICPETWLCCVHLQPPKTNACPLFKGTISIGNTSSNHWFSGDMLVFQGVCIGILLYSLTKIWYNYDMINNDTIRNMLSITEF